MSITPERRETFQKYWEQAPRILQRRLRDCERYHRIPTNITHLLGYVSGLHDAGILTADEFGYWVAFVPGFGKPENVWRRDLVWEARVAAGL